MGQGASTEYGPETEAFVALYQRLPPEAVAKVGALVAKEDMSLLGQHPAAPNPSPPVPVGVTVQIRSNTARAAYTLVPRLQQKQYEMVPKRCTEVQFWKAFFTHLTAIIDEALPGERDALPEPCWKGRDEKAEVDAFTTSWAELNDAKKKAVAALVARSCDALLSPSLAAPPAFPALPLGVEAFIDERAATAALSTVPDLQKKHTQLVPKTLEEKAFWGAFFTHMTDAVADSAV